MCLEIKSREIQEKVKNMNSTPKTTKLSVSHHHTHTYIYIYIYLRGIFIQIIINIYVTQENPLKSLFVIVYVIIKKRKRKKFLHSYTCILYKSPRRRPPI